MTYLIEPVAFEIIYAKTVFITISPLRNINVQICPIDIPKVLKQIEDVLKSINTMSDKENVTNLRHLAFATRPLIARWFESITTPYHYY